MSSQSDPARTLLIVEDDERLRERLARAFGARGLDVRQAHDYDSALQSVRDDSPEYMLVDLRMPGTKSGLDVIRDAKAHDPATVIVVLTGYGSIATALEAVRLGASRFLSKPADADQILAAFTEPAPGGAPVEPDQVPSLARVEWEHINRVVTDCGGNISKAARLLGIHRRSLQRKLGRYPVPR
jgi:two-component system, response regulator RegA